MEIFKVTKENANKWFMSDGQVIKTKRDVNSTEITYRKVKIVSDEEYVEWEKEKIKKYNENLN